MDYKEAIKNIIEYFKEGFERDGPRIFNNINNLRERLTIDHLNSYSDKEFSISDHLISSVISEIFGDLYITGEYNFNVADNALEQLIRRGLYK